MATTKGVGELGRELRVLNLSLVSSDPSQPRKTFGTRSIAELAASLKSQGLLHPPLVRPDPDKRGRYILVDGERRFRAMQQLGWGNANFIILKGSFDEYILQILANLHREDLNPIDEAETYRRLYEEKGYTWEQVAELVGRSLATIVNRVRLLKLPDRVRQWVITKEVSIGDALVLTNFKGPVRDLVGIARALKDGQSPPEFRALKLGVRSAHHGEDDHPISQGDTNRQLEAIVRGIHRAGTTAATIKAFLSLPRPDQQRAWDLIPDNVREGLDDFITAATSAFTEFSEVASGRAFTDILPPLDLQETDESGDEKPKPLSPLGTRAVSRIHDNVLDSLGENPFEIALSTLSTILCGKKKKVILSSRDLVSVLGHNGNHSEVGRKVIASLKLARRYWEDKPTPNDPTNSAETTFITLTSTLRKDPDYGDRSFAEFILKITGMDRNPIDLSPVLDDD